jgi:hypothetical protein
MKPKTVFRRTIPLLAARPALLASHASAQQEISVPFSAGFVADIGSNVQQANNLTNFATLGIQRALFAQTSATGIFTAQGNDIVGRVILVCTNGSTFSIPGAISWRHTSGSTVNAFGFIPSSTTAVNCGTAVTINGGGASATVNGNVGLALVGSTFTYTNGTSVSGNAASPLNALNDYLGTVDGLRPAGPVTVNALSTENTTPTVTGDVVLGQNELFEVVLNGVLYSQPNAALSVDTEDDTWQLVVPAQHALAPGTYSVTATIRNSGGYTLSDPTSNELTILAPSNDTPPAMLTLPTVSGTAQVGATLTGTNGTFSGEPTPTVTRQWVRCDPEGEDCLAIAGATGATYTLVPADAGHTVRFSNTATNSEGSVTSASTAVGPVTAAPAAPTYNGTGATISGTAQVGETLTGNVNGTWSGNPTPTVTYEWLRCDSEGMNCVVIIGATGTTYALVGSDQGHTIRFVAIASNGVGSPSVITSAETVSVVAAPPAPTAPVNTVLPEIQGNVWAGQLVTAGTGTWTGSPTSFAFQWYRCNNSSGGCSAITGATGNEYTINESQDRNRYLRLGVVATNGQGSSAEALSAVSIRVLLGPEGFPDPDESAPPEISGVETVGEVLSSTTGSWGGDEPMTFEYQWERCSLVEGVCPENGWTVASDWSAGNGYTLVDADAGHALRARVRATNSVVVTSGAAPPSMASGATVVIQLDPRIESPCPGARSTAVPWSRGPNRWARRSRPRPGRGRETRPSPSPGSAVMRMARTAQRSRVRTPRTPTSSSTPMSGAGSGWRCTRQSTR